MLVIAHCLFFYILYWPVYIFLFFWPLKLENDRFFHLQMMGLFEEPRDGCVSRKAFVDHMVTIFVERRSLQLTLADYEVK